MTKEHTFANDLIDFVHESPSEFHVVKNAQSILHDNGFSRLDPTEVWELKSGGKYFTTINGSAFAAFIVGTGDIETKKHFNDFQLHLEWKVPASITGRGQARGNSGVFLQGMYELQVLDNYGNKTYGNGQAGSLYKQSAPLVNAMKKPGEWNVYDIIYKAPTFKADGTYRSYPFVTVIHNGVIIQNNTRINGITDYIGFPVVKAHGDGPILLQDHGDPSEAISFRNFWIREL